MSLPRLAFVPLTLALAALVAARPVSAQVITLVVGPADLHDATGADRPLGVAGAIGFERARAGMTRPHLTWRTEFAAVSSAAPEVREASEGPLRHLGLLAHAVYVVPGRILSPYVAAGGGPVLRSVGSPSDEAARFGALGALSAGVRIGPGWRRVMLEARTGATVAGSVMETARTQRWTQLVIGGSFDFRQAPDPGA